MGTGIDFSVRDRWGRLPDLAGIPAASLPPLDGVLLATEALLATAADDFGHLVHRRPLAVLDPGSASDVARMVTFGCQHGIKIGPRGQAKSAYGQAQVEGGIVVRMSSLNRPPVFRPGLVEVSAGLTWSQVLAAALKHGLRPPVMAQTTYLSVGGTLSFGGVDGGSFRSGAQVDTVLELQVVTGEGHIQTCSATRQPELFEAMLAGIGQCGIILRATLPLVSAPTRTDAFLLPYRDAGTLLADMGGPATDGRFDRAIGYVMPAAHGWTCYLLAARHFTPPHRPDRESLLDGLHHYHGFERASGLTYYESAGLGREVSDGRFLRGHVAQPHPWLALLLPREAAGEFAAYVLSSLRPSTPADCLVEFHRINPGLSRHPLLRLPESPAAILVVILSAPRDFAAASRMLERNRAFFERARRMGGTLIPAGAVPLSQQDWREHYGPVWERFLAAKRHFDPDRVMTPGPGIFPA